MNTISALFENIQDGQTITLEPEKVYHASQDDCVKLTGYYCTNTAKPQENPRGERFAAVYLKDKRNITVDGNGATLLIHGKMTPMVFDRCENITVKNFTVDYAVPTMAEFTVEDVRGRDLFLRINPRCLYRIENGCLIWQGENGADGKPYWEDSYIGNRRLHKLYDPETKTTSDFSRYDLEFSEICELEKGYIRAVLKNPDLSLPRGRTLQSRNIVRDHTGSLFQRCKNLRFEGLRIKFMHGLGMVSQFCENVSYVDCDFTPEEGRTIASTADFFQFSGCRGLLKIENCRANGAQDDYVNVHGTHLRIVSHSPGDNSILVRFMHNESWGFQAFEAGDVLDFIRWDTLIPYGSARVKDYTRESDTDIRLFLDSPLPQGVVFDRDVVENASWTPDLYISGCRFGPTSGRGILCTTRGKVVIENNLFENLWGPALLIEDDCNFWFESGYTTDITFRGNTVRGCDFGITYPGSAVIRYTPKVMDESSESFVHGRLTVTGNRFENPRTDRHIFHLEYLREAVISNN
ncbi:MAG: right-handed parallel beta-helix repeat-containing protein, partial [Clostridia bacterium]|nr:right-handed parallel beta-helix repeat-containing protein [Clostridia bacterium]